MQKDLFDEEMPLPVISQGGITTWALEAWLDDDAPSPMWKAGYDFLRSKGVRHRYAALAVWLSLSRDDRGEIETRDDFANLMGVARQTTYQWEERQPVREWAAVLQVMRLQGSRLAEVDERTYTSATGLDSSAADRKLYYQRAGVWEERVGVRPVDTEDGPTGYEDVTDGEVEAIEKALAAEAAGGGAAE
ncbi:MAG: hypothetical protein DRJ03_22315 [Chloroflexi bacterium]|nr:MAG: hypothetical protein DRJ03_22315 [Chloroflexota bacterium]